MSFLSLELGVVASCFLLSFLPVLPSSSRLEATVLMVSSIVRSFKDRRSFVDQCCCCGCCCSLNRVLSCDLSCCSERVLLLLLVVPPELEKFNTTPPLSLLDKDRGSFEDDDRCCCLDLPLRVMGVPFRPVTKTPPVLDTLLPIPLDQRLGGLELVLEEVVGVVG